MHFAWHGSSSHIPIIADVACSESVYGYWNSGSHDKVQTFLKLKCVRMPAKFYMRSLHCVFAVFLFSVFLFCRKKNWKCNNVFESEFIMLFRWPTIVFCIHGNKIETIYQQLDPTLTWMNKKLFKIDICRGMLWLKCST